MRNFTTLSIRCFEIENDKDFKFLRFSMALECKVQLALKFQLVIFSSSEKPGPPYPPLAVVHFIKVAGYVNLRSHIGLQRGIVDSSTVVLGKNGVASV